MPCKKCKQKTVQDTNTDYVWLEYIGTDNQRIVKTSNKKYFVGVKQPYISVLPSDVDEMLAKTINGKHIFRKYQSVAKNTEKQTDNIIANSATEPFDFSKISGIGPVVKNHLYENGFFRLEDVLLLDIKDFTNAMPRKYKNYSGKIYRAIEGYYNANNS